MTIERISINNYNSPITRFIYDDSSINDYDLNPPYQRGYVWGVDRKRNLIKSLVMGLPIGAIILNNRLKAHNYHLPEDSAGYAVVDGKQRISSIMGFVNNEFSVPREWFDDDEVHDGARNSENIYHKDLSDLGRRGLNMISVAVSEASVDSVEKEKELFELINYGGVSQGDTD